MNGSERCRAPGRHRRQPGLVALLAAAEIGTTYNFYRSGERAPLLRERLARYLDERAAARIVLVGEAPGFRGARVSGIPFTSERQLTGAGPAEATASIVVAACDAAARPIEAAKHDRIVFIKVFYSGA